MKECVSTSTVVTKEKNKKKQNWLNLPYSLPKVISEVIELPESSPDD